MRAFVKVILTLVLIVGLVIGFFAIREAPLLIDEAARESPSPSAAVEVTAPHRPEPTTDAHTAPQQTASAPSVSDAGGQQAETPRPSAQYALTDLSTLKASIDDSISDLNSSWDVYIECLADGSSINCGHNRPDNGQMISASIIKIFIMGTVYEQVSLGNIEESAVSGDLKKMITVSDNDATNRLIKLLGDGDSSKGFTLVNKFAGNLGCSHTKLNRLMLDWGEGLENYTSGEDCAKLLRLICSDQCVSSEFSEKMMSLLKAQEKNEGLKWEIPQSVPVASKPGFISGVSIGDVGIVFSEKMTYIICIICNNPNSDDDAKEKISEISALTYQFFNN